VVVYSINAKHLYKHDVNGKRIVASIKQPTDEEYFIHLQDNDKTIAIDGYLGDSSMGNVSFEFEDQRFRWNRSPSKLPSSNGPNAVARFDRVHYSIAKVGHLSHVGFESHMIALILTTIFIARKLLRMKGSTLVLLMLTEGLHESPGSIGSRAILQRKLIETKRALELHSSRMSYGISY